MNYKSEHMIPFADKPSEAFDHEGRIGSLNTGLNSRDEIMAQIMDAKLAEFRMLSEDSVSPDTYGCDSMFLRFFVTHQMEIDFSLIAREFLLHEFGNIASHEMVEYLDPGSDRNWAGRMFRFFILNLMMNAVNAGSTYTKSLFLYLHKTYYRKEYQQLKRFSVLGGRDVIALGKTEKGYNTITIARVLTMARMYGIEVRPDCNPIFSMLNDHNEEQKEDDDTDWDFMDEVFDLSLKCRDEIREMFRDNDEMYRICDKADRFTATLLRSAGYPADYVDLCYSDDPGTLIIMARTLAVLKKTYKNRTFTKEELALYSSVNRAVGALMSSMEETHQFVNEALYGDRGMGGFDDEERLFKADDVIKTKALTAVGDDNRNVSKQELSHPEEEPVYKEDAILKEIDRLNRLVHQQDAEIKGLQMEIAGKRKLAAENKELNERIEEDRRELAALREYVYNLTEEDTIEDTVSVDEMKTFLKGLVLVIVGGHTNWVSKLKADFPEWVYINPTASGTADVNVIDRADKVYFFTDTISHGAYYRYLNAIRDRKIPFGYIHGVNIEKNVRQLYRENK